MDYQAQLRGAFHARLDLAPQEALERARLAIESIEDEVTSHLEVSRRLENVLVVSIQDELTPDVADVTKFVVAAKEEGGSTVVRVRITVFSVHQRRLLGFIPLGQKRVNGLETYARCLEELRRTFG